MATLAALVARWRLKLDDSNEPYLWSNEELTDYTNQALIEMSESSALFKDMTTTATCTIAVAIGSDKLAISDRVVTIERAKLSSDEYPLTMITMAELDVNYGDWQDAADANVMYLIKNPETGYVQLYPPSDVVDTLTLTVTRLPATDQTYAADSGTTVALPSRYFEVLEYGVLYRAFQKSDIDTSNKKRSDEMRELFKEGIERVKRAVLRLSVTDISNTMHPGNM